MAMISLLLMTNTAGFAQPIYNVVEVREQRVYAGKLGDRVRESLVIESGSQRYTIRIEGKSHTQLSGRVGQVKVGDKVTLTGKASPKDGSVRREDIRKIQ